MNTALLLLLAAVATGVERAEPGETPSSEYVGGLSVGRVWEGDIAGGPSLEGFRIGFTASSGSPDSAFGHVGTWYLEWKRSRHQEILEGGLELTFPYFELARVGFGPRFRLGVLDREAAPLPGTDGVIGVGLELSVKLSERLQIAALADRSAAFGAGTRNSFSMNLRVFIWND